MVRLLRSTLTFVALGVLAALTAACGGTTTSPSSSPPYSTTDLRLGTGTTAITGSVVTVNYTAWLYDASKPPDQKGLEVDTSTGRPAFSFTVGAAQLITGFENGVLGMNVGGLRRVVVPPSLGYGASRSGSIPPSATLVFEIELVDVQ